MVDHLLILSYTAPAFMPHGQFGVAVVVGFGFLWNVLVVTGRFPQRVCTHIRSTCFVAVSPSNTLTFV